MYLKPKQFCDERLHFRLERNYIRTFYKFYFEVAIWELFMALGKLICQVLLVLSLAGAI